MSDRNDRIRRLEMLKLQIYNEILEKKIEEENKRNQQQLDSGELLDNSPQGLYNRERYKLLALSKRYQKVNQKIDELLK